MAKKENKRYLFRHFKCENCGGTIAGPCNCMCPYCGNMMLDKMILQCYKLLQYTMACYSAVYDDQGRTLTEEQQFQLHGPKSADFLHDARIMIDDGWSYITSDLDEIGNALDSYKNGWLQPKNFAGSLFGIGGIALSVFLLVHDYWSFKILLLAIFSLFCIWKYGKGVLEDVQGRVSMDEVSAATDQNKELQERLGFLNDVFDVVLKMGTFDNDARAAVENLSPEAHKFFELILREAKPYSNRIREGLRDGNQTVDEVLDEVYSLKRL